MSSKHDQKEQNIEPFYRRGPFCIIRSYGVTREQNFIVNNINFKIENCRGV